MVRRSVTRCYALFMIALACAATSAHAGSPYEAFRFPDVRTQQFSTNGRFSMSSGRSTQLDFAQRDYNTQAQFALSGSRLDQTDRHTRRLTLNTRTLWAKGLDRMTDVFGTTINSVASDRDFMVLNSGLSWSEDWFTENSRWGFGSTVSAVHLYGRSGRESKSSGLTPPNEDIGLGSAVDWNYFAVGTWTIDAGRGRVRDVTGVVRAAALAERLESFGRLAHPLSEGASLKLAQLFSAEGELFSVHERPDRFVWREVARILRDDGALKNNELDAEALERVQEYLAPRALFSLHHGTRLEAVLELSRAGGHTDSRRHTANLSLNGGTVTSASSSDASSSIRQDIRRSRVGVAVETSHPQGLFSQWAATCRLLTGDGPARSLEMTTMGSYQRMLLDRLYSSVRAEHRTFITKSGDSYGEPVWNIDLAGTLSYLVEDHWSIDLLVRHGQAVERSNRISNPFPGFLSTGTSNQLNLGLTWRPSGRFDSPTLGISERPMAMAR